MTIFPETIIDFLDRKKKIMDFLDTESKDNGLPRQRANIRKRPAILTRDCPLVTGTVDKYTVLAPGVEMTVMRLQGVSRAVSRPRQPASALKQPLHHQPSTC